MVNRLVKLGVVALVILLLFPHDAFAYLDPGSGSLIFQTLVASVAAVAYGVRLYWTRITRWFRRSPSVPDLLQNPSDRPGESQD